MARVVIPLTVTKINKIKGRSKDYKLADGQGLYLLVRPSGSKLWRFKYRFNNKEKVIAIGKYPEISLASARDIRLKFREQVASGIDPTILKKEEADKKLNVHNEEMQTLQVIAEAYLDKRNELSISYMSKLRGSFKNDVFSFIGSKPITRIMPKDIIDVIKRVEKRGAVEGAHRLFTQLNKVFKYAVSNQFCTRNPCSEMDKNEILKTPVKRKYPTITDPNEIKCLLEAIDKYSGNYTTRMALAIAPYVCLRPSNIRLAQWHEIDFDMKLWRIPDYKMKGRIAHIIPLTSSTLSIFREMKKYSGDAKYIFHSIRSPDTPMSDATMNNALRRMGYSQDEIVVHGFRAMFSTVAHEISNFKHEVIEAQLAHTVGSQVSLAYNRAIYLEDRKQLMQWWSDYLDNLK